MRRRLTVSIADGAVQTLVRLAATERRHPREQAALILERSLTAIAGHDQQGPEAARVIPDR